MAGRNDQNRILSDEVIRAEYNAVYSYALALCRKPEEAEDITQETFLKALNANRRAGHREQIANRRTGHTEPDANAQGGTHYGDSAFNGGSTIYTWLCAIAKNIWLDRCRKESRRAQTVIEPTGNFLNPGGSSGDGSESLLYQAAEPGPGPEEQLLIEDEAMRIHVILHTLDEPYKEVFSLRTFGELKFSAIASLFGKTESWARVTYHRARKMIMTALETESK